MNFLKKIFSSVCLTISLLLLIYTFYKSEIHWNGLNRDFYLTYYIISFLLIIFSFITFFINQKIKEYLIISLISITVCLYTFEGYLTFKEQHHREQLYEKETGKKYDTRTKLKIYEDLNKNNNYVVDVGMKYYFTHKNISDILPISGISNSKTIHCNENGYFSIYESDRYGFNNPDKEWDNKTVEYLLVGDSFVHGNCVNRPNDISSVLRKLSKKSILNLGYEHRRGPLVEYATLREYLNSNVKKVLWIYFEGNDLIDLANELNNKTLKNYINDLTFTQNLKLRQNEINVLANTIIEREKEKERQKIFTFDLLKFIKIYYLRLFILTQSQTQQPLPQQPLPLPEFKKILGLAKDLTIKNNSKLYFIYLPEYSRYKIKYNNTSYNLVKKIVNELDIPFIDIHKEVFEKEQNPLKLFPFELPGHYNVDGYKKVAETIYKFTKD